MFVLNLVKITYTRKRKQPRRAAIRSCVNAKESQPYRVHARRLQKSTTTKNPASIFLSRPLPLKATESTQSKLPLCSIECISSQTTKLICSLPSELSITETTRTIALVCGAHSSHPICTQNPVRLPFPRHTSKHFFF